MARPGSSRVPDAGPATSPSSLPVVSGALGVAGVHSLTGALAIAFVAAQVQAQSVDRPAVPTSGGSTLPVDSDGDGLADVLEAGQHSAMDLVDTDGDGWNDAEELARGSLAGVNCSQPSTNPEADLGARAYMRAGKLHVAFAIWVRNGTLGDLQLDLGVRVGQRTFPLAPSTYAARMTLTTVPTKLDGQLLLVADVVLPSSPLVQYGATSFYGQLRLGNEVLCADSVDLMLRDGVPTELISPSEISPMAEEQLGPGLIYRPLGGAQIPNTWTSGEICFQRLEPVGVHGAVVTQEVTSATCLSGWDGYCDAGSCNSSVGTTVDLVDPTALVGG